MSGLLSSGHLNDALFLPKKTKEDAQRRVEEETRFLMMEGI